MSQVMENRQFGQRQASSIVISSNGKSSEYKIHAGLLAAIGTIFAVFMTGYIAATGYLAFRDDLISATLIRQTRMQHEYEDRIAALRSKVDRITSRQLLDQQAIESKVAELMKQQDQIAGQSGALNGLLERAKANGLGNNNATTIPVPTVNPQKAASIDFGVDLFKTGSTVLLKPTEVADASSFLRGSKDWASTKNSGATSAGAFTSANLLPDSGSEQKSLFHNVMSQINSISTFQRTQIASLHDEARKKASKIAGLIEDLKIPLPKNVTENIGGPYMPVAGLEFEDMTQSLDEALDTLDSLRTRMKKLPTGNPIPGAAVSSTFGNRVDPFRNTAAFHSGMDFKASSGTQIQATGDGTVLSAGLNGGYGMMVEIDHGNGVTTRYAHMSKILVAAGQKITKGSVIGRVGSTGRSTGPHLHYEVRRSEQATNPAKFLNTGIKLSSLL